MAFKRTIHAVDAHAGEPMRVIVASGDRDWNNPSTWTGSLDRCLCGTGTYARGQLKIDEKFRHMGTPGTVFTGELVEDVDMDGTKAVVPCISGEAWIYGMNTRVPDPTDPVINGFKFSNFRAWRPHTSSRPSGRKTSGSGRREGRTGAGGPNVGIRSVRMNLEVRLQQQRAPLQTTDII